MKYCRRESPGSVSGFDHLSFSFVPVLLDDYSMHSAKMEVRQHVARRKSGDEELFGIVPMCIAPERRIRRPEQIGLRLCPNQVVSPI
jgi:hypothetical protein